MGPAASRFRPGEDVFGDLLDHIGGFAEYVCVPERALAPMPEGMAYEEAACLPPAGAIAWQFATGSSHDQTFTWTLTVAISPGRVRRADVDIGS